MSFIKTTGEKKLMLFSGRAHPELAEAIAKELGTELTPTDGLRLRQRRDLRPLQESVRGSDAFVIQATPPR